MIDDFLQGAAPEVWNSDLYAPQVGTAAGVHQICLSHQLRDLTDAVEADDLVGRLWAVALRHVFGRAIRLHREQGLVRPETFARRRVRIEKATDRLVFGPPLPLHSQARRLQKRYQQHRGSLYVFLEREAVVESRAGAVADRSGAVHAVRCRLGVPGPSSVSSPRSSNRACSSPAPGFPRSFIAPLSALPCTTPRFL